MKIISGNWRKHSFVDEYIKKNKGKYLVIETSENSYPFEQDDLLLAETEKECLITDITKWDSELENDRIFILFTNENEENFKYYKENLSFLKREVIIVLNTISGTRVYPYILQV
jgi:hypothetical protein